MLGAFGAIASQSEIDTKAAAIFINSNYYFTDSLTLSVGIRYTKETKDLDFLQNNQSFTTHPDFSTLPSLDESAISGNLTLNYNMTDDSSVYLSVSRGFKSGGFNPDIVASPDIAFDNETVVSYELGVKSDLADGKVRLNGAVFFTDYQDLQVQRLGITAAGIGFAISNAKAAEIFGAELELTALITDKLTFEASIGYSDTEFTDQRGKPAYEGHLNFRVASVANLLRDAGYHTYMAGKWHLGETRETSPAARGFDESFVLLGGGASHFDDSGMYEKIKASYRANGELVAMPEDFYSSDYYTDRIIANVDANLKDNKPFFAYLAYTAPHFPLHAPDSYLKKYRGRYDAGYENLHKQRTLKAGELGIIPTVASGAALIDDEPAGWGLLDKEERKIEARKMEVYAAMVDAMDANIGRLLDYLEQIGEHDNTFILFMSDNGPEGHQMHRYETIINLIRNSDNSYENMGKQGSYIYYGPGWAWAGAAPFRSSKGFIGEGGIRVAGFINYPELLKRQGISEAFISVMDVAPTLLQLAGTNHPGEEYQGRKVLPMQGKSILPYLLKETDQVHATDYAIGWELFDKRAIRQGDWKMLMMPRPYGNDTWQLYNLARDPAESEDLATKRPNKCKTLLKLWEQYVTDNGVILPNQVINY